MKKIVSLLLVLVVVLSCVGLAACGGGGGGAVVDDGGSHPADGNGGGNGGGNGNGNGDGNGGGESLTDIVGQVGGIDSVSYTMVASGQGIPSPITTRIWMEGNKFRTESGDQETMIFIVNYDTGKAYMYIPSQNIAMTMDISQVTPPDYEKVQDIPGYNPTIIGTETMDGKECLVVEYNDGQATVKSWIWKQHGFPVRTETTTAEGTTVVEFKNIDFSDIDDSMFELPPGVQIMGS